MAFNTNEYYVFNLHGGYWYITTQKIDGVKLDNRSRKISCVSTETQRRRPSKTTLTKLYHMGIHTELLSGLYCEAKLYPVKVPFARDAWHVEARTRGGKFKLLIQYAMYEDTNTPVRTVLEDTRESSIYSRPRRVNNTVMHLGKYPAHAGTHVPLDKIVRHKAERVLGKKGFKYGN